MKLTYDRVLVTGVAGFIGSHTTEALLRNGVQVRRSCRRSCADTTSARRVIGFRAKIQL